MTTSTCRQRGRGSEGHSDRPKATQQSGRAWTPRPAPSHPTRPPAGQHEGGPSEQSDSAGPRDLAAAQGGVPVSHLPPEPGTTGTTGEPGPHRPQRCLFIDRNGRVCRGPRPKCPAGGQRLGQLGSVLPGGVASWSSSHSGAAVGWAAAAASSTSSRAPSPATRHTSSPLAARISSMFLREGGAVTPQTLCQSCTLVP